MRILSCLSEALSKSPARTRLRKVSHSARENAMIGPRGFLESRIRTDCSAEATSTQASFPLAVLFRQMYWHISKTIKGASVRGKDLDADVAMRAPSTVMDNMDC